MRYFPGDLDRCHQSGCAPRACSITSPQSLTPLYLCHATINKDTQRLRNTFLKRREGKRWAIEKTISPDLSTTILWYSLDHIHARTNLYAHMCVAWYRWPGGWCVDRFTVCSRITTACTQRPWGLHRFGSHEGKENGDSFGGDSLKKKWEKLTNIKKKEKTSVVLMVKTHQHYGLSSFCSAGEAKRAPKREIKGHTMTKAAEQQGLWKQTEYLDISPHVLCTALTARSGLLP